MSFVINHLKFDIMVKVNILVILWNN